MACTYLYKNKKFDSELALDDFLMEHKKLHSKYGDIVFSRSTIHNKVIDILKEAGADSEELKRRYQEAKEQYFDGETVKEFEPPYIGVTKFLSGLRNSDGDLLFPEFIIENYWKNRFSKWKENNYNDTEKEIIFNNEETRPLQGKEVEYFRSIIENKWSQDAKIGTEVHKILQTYFSTVQSGKNKGKLMGSMSDDFLLNVILPKKINKDLLDDRTIKDTLKIARQLEAQIYKIYGKNCTFYPEFTISGKVNNPTDNSEKTLLGMIDLLVIDEEGNAHIIDYKVSSKPYGKFSEPKKLAYTYQQAIYNRLLEKYGINVDNSDISVMPLQLLNQTNIDNIFKYSGIKPIQEQKTNSKGELTDAILLDSVKNRIEQSQKIQGNLEELIPSDFLNHPSTNNLLQTVQDTESHWFPKYNSNRRSFTDESIAEELKDIKPTDTKQGRVYEYTIGKKTIVANSEEELFNKVKVYREKLYSARTRLTTNLINVLKEGIKNEDPNIDLPKNSPIFSGLDANWLQNKLAKYCNHLWQIVPCDEIVNFGMIILQNKNTGQLDFIKISTNNLNYQRHFGNKDRLGLSGAFEPDLNQESNSESKMLKAKEGNIELMEAMLVINNLEGLFNKKATLGSVEVINPYQYKCMTAYNEELLYSFNTLDKFYSVPNNKYKSGDIKMASKYQLTLNTFKDIMTLGIDKSWSGDFKSFRNFSTSLDMMYQNLNTNKDSKIMALQNLISEMEKTWNLGTNNTQQSQLSSKHVYLYNMAQLALAELRGITFRQQTEESDKWLESFMILKKGVSGIYLDNSGNLSSNTLNLLTKLSTEVYQNVRVDLQEPTAKVRNLVKNLKRVYNFNSLSEYTIGNPANLYKRLIKVNSDGDIVFTNLDDPKLFKEERDFLEYALDIINKNRFPDKTDEELEELKKSGDISYYRVPLAKGDLESELAVKGLFESLKDRLRNFNPKVIAQKVHDISSEMDKVDQEEDDAKRIEQASKLFELGVEFDTGEGNSRLDYIKQKGGLSYFETNLETLLLKHIFEYSVKNNMNKVFPTMKAAMAHLAIQGANQNRVFNNDLQYFSDYVTSKIKNESIIPSKYQFAYKTLNTLKEATSTFILAFSPVQFFYQGLQGIWNDIRLIIQKPDIASEYDTSAFTVKNMRESFLGVYSDLFNFSSEPTVNSLVNELYGLNDMDMNTYIDKIKTDQHGVFNFRNLMFKLSSRPDYYNRLTIFGAQMRHDGCWEAHSIVKGKLVYDWTKDKRFSVFAKSLKNPELKNHPDYQKQRSLYYAVAQQFANEHARYEDRTEFILDMNNPKPLPRAYTNQQSESYKAIADDIYGYYTHEKKSLMHSLFIGSLFMQFKTFWTGKKNQYLGKGGVKLRGSWQHYYEIRRDENGNPILDKDGKAILDYYYYQVDKEGTVLWDESPLTKEELEKRGMPAINPVMRWKGQWQEGILITLADIFGDSPKEWRQNFIEKWYNPDPMLRNVYRSNIKQFGFDIIMFLLGGCIISALLQQLFKEFKSEVKQNPTLTNAGLLSAVNVAFKSVTNSFIDYNFGQSLAEPVTSWTPVSLEWGARTLKNLSNAALGDTSFWDAVMNTSSALKLLKPGLDIISSPAE